MISVAVKDSKGKETGRVDLLPAVFEAPVKPVVLREVVNRYMANQRQGTHSTKTQAMVSGGGRKPWKQKHTGRARQGSTRATQWRGGGTTFGPHPRSYWTKMPKKKRQVALRSALSDLAQKNSVFVVEDFGLSAKPKTKDALALLAALGLAEKKVLILTDAPNSTLILSARNLPNVKVSVVNNLNIYDLLYYDALILSRPALERIQEMYQS